MYADDEEPRIEQLEFYPEDQSIPMFNYEQNYLLQPSDSHTPTHSDTTSISQSNDNKDDMDAQINKLCPNDTCVMPFVMPYGSQEQNLDNTKPKNMRLKKKITKAKSRCISAVPQNTTLNKKQVQMIRNRIAAQESRNRKKKEFDDLKTENGRLKAENEILRQQLLHKQTQINSMYEVVDRLSPEARTEFENKRKNITSKSVSRPFPIFRLPVLMSTILLGIFCFACLFGVYHKTSQVSLPQEGYAKFAPKQISGDQVISSNECASSDIKRNSSSNYLITTFKKLENDTRNMICMECREADGPKT